GFNLTSTDLSGNLKLMYRVIDAASGSSFALGGDRSLTLETLSGDGAASTFAGTIGGAGSLIKRGGASLTLSGANTYTGGTTVSGGTLAISSESNLGASPSTANAASLVLNGGTVQATLGATGTTNSFALSANRGMTLGVSGGGFRIDPSVTLNYAGAVAGTGGLTKSGSGTLTLSGVNTYLGSTTVNGGILRLGTNDALGSGAINVASGATLDLNAFSLTNTLQSLTLSGIGVTTGPTSLGALHNSASNPASVAGSIRLANDTLITSGGDITLNGSISNASGAGRSLEVRTSAAGSPSPVVTFGLDVGTQTSRLSSLAITGSTRLRGNVFTSGAQSFAGDVAVNGGLSLNSNTGGVSILGNLTMNAAPISVLEFLGGGAYRFNGTAFSALPMSSQPAGVSLSFNATTGLYGWTSPYSGSVKL
ncbi:MAG: hypothetical protein EBS23_10245, partial [Betaproteobacteria bacterium]|nr:hypothetical protein [Betaproteobacteria bacterium]